MPKEPSNRSVSIPGSILRRLLRENGNIPYDRAARAAGVGPKTIWRICTGKRALELGEAEEMIKGFKRMEIAFSRESANELLASARNQAGRAGYAAGSDAARELGKFITGLRRKSGATTRELAPACGIKQPNLVFIETGKSVPSPLLASRLAARLELPPRQAAEYFRRFGQALEHSALAKSTTAPALTSLVEWLLFSCVSPTPGTAVVGMPLSEIGPTQKSIPAVRKKLEAAVKEFALQAQQSPGSSSAPLPNACFHHEDGTVTLILPVVVTF